MLAKIGSGRREMREKEKNLRDSVIGPPLVGPPYSFKTTEN